MSITWPAPSAPSAPEAAAIPVPGLPVPRGRTAVRAAAATAAGLLAVAGAVSLQRELQPAAGDAVTPFGALHAVHVAPARPIPAVSSGGGSAVLHRVHCAGARKPDATACFTALG